MKPITLAAIEWAAWFGSLSRWRFRAYQQVLAEPRTRTLTQARKAERRFVQARAAEDEHRRLVPLPDTRRIERRVMTAIARSGDARGDQAHFLECSSVGCRRCDRIVSNFERLGKAATP